MASVRLRRFLTDSISKPSSVDPSFLAGLGVGIFITFLSMHAFTIWKKRRAATTAANLDDAMLHANTRGNTVVHVDAELGGQVVSDSATATAAARDLRSADAQQQSNPTATRQHVRFDSNQAEISEPPSLLPPPPQQQQQQQQQQQGANERRTRIPRIWRKIASIRGLNIHDSYDTVSNSSNSSTNNKAGKRPKKANSIPKLDILDSFRDMRMDTFLDSKPTVAPVGASGGHISTVLLESLGLQARMPSHGNTNSPLSAVEALLEQDATFQIKPEQLNIGRQIGQGGAGRIFEGNFCGSNVAIKEIYSMLPHMNPNGRGKEKRRRRGRRESSGENKKSGDGSGGSIADDENSESAKARDQLMREFQHLRRLRHPNVITLFGATVKRSMDTGEQRFLIVTELARFSLRDLIKSDEVLTLPTCVRMAAQSAAGCSFIHSMNIIHFDIKPGNLLVDKAGVVKVADLGISKICAQNNTDQIVAQTMTSIQGTPAYMAPEMLRRDNSAIGYAVDIYAWALVLWEMLHRRRPHPNWPLAQLFSKILINSYRPPVGPLTPARLRNLLQQCWDPNPRMRPTFDSILIELALTFEELTEPQNVFGQGVRVCVWITDELESQGQARGEGRDGHETRWGSSVDYMSVPGKDDDCDDYGDDVIDDEDDGKEEEKANTTNNSNSTGSSSGSSKMDTNSSRINSSRMRRMNGNTNTSTPSVSSSTVDDTTARHIDEKRKQQEAQGQFMCGTALGYCTLHTRAGCVLVQLDGSNELLHIDVVHVFALRLDTVDTSLHAHERLFFPWRLYSVPPPQDTPSGDPYTTLATHEEGYNEDVNVDVDVDVDVLGAEQKSEPVDDLVVTMMKENGLVLLDSSDEVVDGMLNKALDVATLRLVSVKSIQVRDDETRDHFVKQLDVYMNTFKPRQGDGLTGEGSCNVIQIEKILEDVHYVHVVTEYMNSGSVASLIDASDGGGCRNEFVLASIAQQILRALRDVHAAPTRCFGDIAPNKLLLNSHGRVVLSDFGYGLDNNEHDSGHTTTPYMSPESLNGEPLCGASDVWALGACLVAIATGNTSYIQCERGANIDFERLDAISTPETLLNILSAEFVSFIDACMAVNVGERASVDQLLDHTFVTTHFGVNDDRACETLACYASANLLSEDTNTLAQLANSYIDEVLRSSGGDESRQAVHLSKARIRELARQIGLSYETVEAAFVNAAGRM